MPDYRKFGSGGSKSIVSIMKWVFVAIAVAVIAYIAYIEFFFRIGKAVVGTVTG